MPVVFCSRWLRAALLQHSGPPSAQTAAGGCGCEETAAADRRWLQQCQALQRRHTPGATGGGSVMPRQSCGCCHTGGACYRCGWMLQMWVDVTDVGGCYRCGWMLQMWVDVTDVVYYKCVVYNRCGWLCVKDLY